MAVVDVIRCVCQVSRIIRVGGFAGRNGGFWPQSTGFVLDPTGYVAVGVHSAEPSDNSKPRSGATNTGEPKEPCRRGWVKGGAR